MTTRHLKQHCKLTQDSQELIRVAMSELNLSARAYDRILKVSRTIADLDDKIDISPRARQRSDSISHLRSHALGLRNARAQQTDIFLAAA
jgi:predicted ATPase with chaperone activity